MFKRHYVYCNWVSDIYSFSALSFEEKVIIDGVRKKKVLWKIVSIPEFRLVGHGKVGEGCGGHEFGGKKPASLIFLPFFESVFSIFILDCFQEYSDFPMNSIENAIEISNLVIEREMKSKH